MTQVYDIVNVQKVIDDLADPKVSDSFTNVLSSVITNLPKGWAIKTIHNRISPGDKHWYVEIISNDYKTTLTSSSEGCYSVSYALAEVMKQIQELK